MPAGPQPVSRVPSTPGTKNDIYATLTSPEEDDAYDESLGLQPGDLLGGNFELTERVGSGAMGEVWLAREQVKGEYSRDVVVKIVPKDIQNAEVEIERVRTTFLTIQALQHAHICPVYYLGNDDRFGYFLVMKHIAGRNLLDYVIDYRKQNKKQPTLDVLLPMLAQFASALDYAHSKGVIHRDVKPQNLLHSREDGAQLIDFGLAESVKTDDGTPSAVSGTIVYMSPEQLQGEYQDKHSDQYSFAATVYELLTGQPPFLAGNNDILYDRILYDQIMPIRNVDQSVNDALARALSKKREERFENCTNFVNALGKHIEEEKQKKQLYLQIHESAKTASTWQAWQSLAAQFRDMNGYKNTAELAEQCETRALKLKKQTEPEVIAVEKVPSPTAVSNTENWKDAVLELLTLKQYSKALSRLEAAKTGNPNDPEVFYYAAICRLKGEDAFLAQRPDIDKIVKDLESALKISPQKGIYRYFLAYIKYDYFDQKYINITPDYQEELAIAHKIGIPQYDIKKLYDDLCVERPDVL